MVNETKTFSTGELVFAKLRGYTPWPAIITKCINNKSFDVCFYGTGEIGYKINANNLFKYVEGKQKFATYKNLKRRLFRLAFEEIEAAIAVKNAAPTNLFATEQAPAIGNDNVADEAEIELISGNQQILDESYEKEELPNSIYAIFLPTHGHCGIKLDHNKPKCFANAEKRRAWEANSVKAAGILKEELLLGLQTVESLSSCLVFNLQHYKLHPEVAKRFDEDVTETVDALDIEDNFLNLSLELRGCLGLGNADTVRCLEILHELKQFKLKPLMLLRNPACVDIIGKLRAYIGNQKDWNLNADEAAEFTRQTEIIRTESMLIYDNFKQTLKRLDSENFWDDFCKRADSFADTFRLNVEHSLKTIQDPTCTRIIMPKTNHEMSELAEQVPYSDNADNIDYAESVAEEDGEVYLSNDVCFDDGVDDSVDDSVNDPIDDSVEDYYVTDCVDEDEEMLIDEF